MGFWRPRRIKISGDPVTSSMDVIAVGSLFAHRQLMAVEGKVLIGKQSELDCLELCVSTCKITKAGIGGPLIDIDGNFVGMNFHDEEETPFLPRDVIHRLLNNKWSSVDDTIVEGIENRWFLPGRTHKNADAIATLTETNGRCLCHDVCVHPTVCVFAKGLFLSHVMLQLDPPDHLHHDKWPLPEPCHVGRVDDHC